MNDIGATLEVLVRDDGDAEQGIMCIVDGPGATWRISFDRPLQAARNAGALRLVTATESAIVAYGLAPAILDALLIAERITVLIFSRVSGPSVRPLIAAARRQRIAVVYFLDDDLLAIPDELGSAKVDFYRRPARQTAMHHALAEADIVYASTELLGHRLRAYAPGASVVAGTMYCAAGRLSSPSVARQPVIGYMGTGGHGADLDYVAEAICAVMEQHENIRFTLFGTLKPSKWLKHLGERVTLEPGIADYDAFLDKLATMPWGVALAPLAPIPFNMTKASTKFIEYTSAAMPSVVAAGPVYAGPIAAGVCRAAASTAEWADAILRTLEDHTNSEAMVKRAQTFVARTYTSERLAAQLEDVLDRALVTAAAR